MKLEVHRSQSTKIQCLSSDVSTRRPVPWPDHRSSSPSYRAGTADQEPSVCSTQPSENRHTQSSLVIQPTFVKLSLFDVCDCMERF